jgi:hypothetical protein
MVAAAIAIASVVPVAVPVTVIISIAVASAIASGSWWLVVALDSLRNLVKERLDVDRWVACRHVGCEQ